MERREESCMIETFSTFMRHQLEKRLVEYLKYIVEKMIYFYEARLLRSENTRGLLKVY